MPGHIPWNEELETLLLHCVIVKGAHICGGKKVTQTWGEVNEMFFNQDALKDSKEAHYTPGNFRKLRTKFQNVLTTVENDIATGNQSGKEGELSELYRNVQTISDDIALKDAMKEAGGDLRAKLNETEQEVLSKSGPLKRKLLNGEIIDNTRADHPAPLSFDERLLMLAAGPGQNDHSRGNNAVEEVFEVAFLEWIDLTKKTVTGLADCVGVNATHHADLDDIGLKTLVSIYCTREANFSARVFKDEVRAMELPMVAASKLYMGLQEWRRQFELEQDVADDMMTSVTTTTSNSSSSSSSASPVSSIGMASPLAFVRRGA